MIEKPVVVIDFDGPEGNTMVIVGRCCAAARDAGWPASTIHAFTEEILMSNREHVMDVLFECFDVRVPVVSSCEVDRTMVR